MDIVVHEEDGVIRSCCLRTGLRATLSLSEEGTAWTQHRAGTVREGTRPCPHKSLLKTGARQATAGGKGQERRTHSAMLSVLAL